MVKLEKILLYISFTLLSNSLFSQSSNINYTSIDTIYCDDAVNYIYNQNFINDDSLIFDKDYIILVRYSLFWPTAYHITMGENSIEGDIYKVIDKDKVSIKKIEEWDFFKDRYMDAKMKLDQILPEKNRITSIPNNIKYQVKKPDGSHYLLKSSLNGKDEELRFCPNYFATCSQNDFTESEAYLDCINSNECKVLNEYFEIVENITKIFHSLYLKN